MSLNRNKFAVLLLLALLQCFAPLLHVHVHGYSAASGLHIDGVDELLALNSGEPAFEAARDDATAIAMPAELRHKSTIELPEAGQAVLAAATRPHPVLALRLPPGAGVCAFPTAPPIHSQPFSRAPPPQLT